MTHLNEKFKWYVLIILIMNIIGLINHETLLFDGSDYILNLILKRSIIETNDLRNLAFFLFQFPSYFYIRFIGNEMAITSLIFELTHVFLPILLLCISRFINKSFSSFHLLLYFVIVGFSSLLRISELNLSVHFAMLALSCFLLEKQVGNIVLGYMFILMSSLCYPFIILLTPIFFILPSLNKIYSYKSKAYVIFFIFITLVFSFQLFSISSYVKNFAESSENFFNAVFSIEYLKYYVVVLIYMIFIYIFKKNIIMSSLLALSFLFYLLFMDFRIYFHFAGRSLSLVMAALTIYFSLLVYIKNIKLNYFVLNLIVFMSCMSLVASYSFNIEKNKLLSYLSQKRGVIDRNEAVKECKSIRYFSSDHALFIYSVLIQNKVESVVNNFIPYSHSEIRKKLKILLDTGVKINKANFEKYLN